MNPLLASPPNTGNPLLAPLTGSDLQAIAAWQAANPVMAPYSPSLRESIGNAVYDGASAIGLDDIANRMRNDTQSVVDMVPVIGDMVGADDAGRDFANGNYLDAAIAGLGVMPGVGEMAGKVGKGLRARYRWALLDAAAGKDPARIKLTPERIDAAKQSLKDSIDRWNYWRGEGAPPATPQMQNAQTFAGQMAQQGEDVRFKMPNGPNGSLYVRVGDKGTVRFADHPQPTVGGQAVGGYSNELGRRHYPAQYSVSPGEMTLDDVLRIYGGGSGQ